MPVRHRIPKVPTIDFSVGKQTWKKCKKHNSIFTFEYYEQVVRYLRLADNFGKEQAFCKWHKCVNLILGESTWASFSNEVLCWSTLYPLSLFKSPMVLELCTCSQGVKFPGFPAWKLLSRESLVIREFAIV